MLRELREVKIVGINNAVNLDAPYPTWGVTGGMMYAMRVIRFHARNQRFLTRMPLLNHCHK